MYSNLTAEELRQILKQTSEHSFSFNIQRVHENEGLEINTEPGIYEIRVGDRKIPLLRALYEFQNRMSSLDDISKILRWKTELIDHYETPDEIRSSVGYRGHDVLGFELLARIRDAYSYNSIKEDIFAHLLAFNTLCAKNLEEAKKDFLVDYSYYLGQAIIACRSEAMKFGIPMENVLEVLVGARLEDQEPENAVKTILFGLKPEPTLKDLQATYEQLTKEIK